ncbi:MAG: hypothetical protein U0929_10960 [Planctomycetaceae bacterium]
MALSRSFEVVEISGLRLDQPLAHCGNLSPAEAQVASTARYVAVQRAFQKAIDRHVDLIVLHSDILSQQSAGGRAPWFLGSLIENSGQHGIPVVWVEGQHNPWMEHFVPSPSQLVRMVTGEVRRVVTRSGALLVHAGTPSPPALHAWHDDVQGTIGIDFGVVSPVDRNQCDLVLHHRIQRSDRVEDFVASTHESDAPSLATLHTLRVDRANSSEMLNVASIGLTQVKCSLSVDVIESKLAEQLGEEVDAAAGRYFENAPQTQLLIVDLNVSGHGQVWDSLWSPDHRESLIHEMNLRTRHPGCHVRTMSLDADVVEASRSCPWTPTLQAVWNDATSAGSTVRSLADIAPETLSLGDWSRHQPIPTTHPLADEVRHACLHLLRSAS